MLVCLMTLGSGSKADFTCEEAKGHQLLVHPLTSDLWSQGVRRWGRGCRVCVCVWWGHCGYRSQAFTRTVIYCFCSGCSSVSVQR